MRRISVVVLLVVFISVLASTIALPAFAGGKPDFAGGGGPDNPNGFGSAASQVATDKGPNTGTEGKGGLGEHSSSQEEPRQGVGNVARNDGAEGDHPGDHACLVAEQMDIDCTQKPGKG